MLSITPSLRLAGARYTHVSSKRSVERVARVNKVSFAGTATPKLKVYLLEDENRFAVPIQRILREAGHEVVGHAVDADTAAREIATLKPDVVLLDLFVDEPWDARLEDGAALAEELKGQGFPVERIIMISRDTNNEWPEKNLFEPFPYIPKNHFLSRPTYLLDVLAKIEPLKTLESA